MIDVFDYLRRLSLAVVVYPAITALAVLAGLSGLRLDEFIPRVSWLAGSISASSAGDGRLLLELLVYWALLSFICFLATYIAQPPRFHYTLRRGPTGYRVDLSPNAGGEPA
jgi:hypothetical protein